MLKTNVLVEKIWIPEIPVVGLAKPLELIPSKKFNFDKLHSKLISFLVSNFDVADLTLPK